VTGVGMVDLSTSHPRIFAPLLAELGMPVRAVLDPVRAAEFRRDHPDVAVLVLTTYADDGSIAGALADAPGGPAANLARAAEQAGVYEAALARAARLSGAAAVERARVLAIGDAIRTDIAGAAAFGIASLFVARGIHGAELGLDQGGVGSSEVQDWIDRQAVRPDALIETLVWE